MFLFYLKHHHLIIYLSVMCTNNNFFMLPNQNHNLFIGCRIHIRKTNLVCMKISELFDNNENRLNDLTRRLDLQSSDDYIYFDFSKTHTDKDMLNKYIEKLEKLDVYNKINGMFNGEKINYTEKRSVLHVLLRNKNILRAINDNSAQLTDSQRSIYNELIKMKDFSSKLHKGELKGCTGKTINSIVNIGIGGSDLGPRMVCDTLKYYAVKGITAKFISNIDATATIDVFSEIDPDRTLFIVVSKTFTTLETVKNMELACKYLEKHLEKDRASIYEHHFVAVSSNIDEVSKYKINNVFAMWDFVGGRYSLWSTVGLSIVLYIGFDNFVQLLRGASATDEQFINTKGLQNIEILHALVECFYSDMNYDNKCIVSYDQYMEKMYLYLQQAEMESNGKASKSSKDTGMVIWGGVGTDAQHSFFQLLHQGTRRVLSEFLFPIKPLHSELEHHNMILANCFAQSMALMLGKKGKEGLDHFDGDRPSISIGYSKLTPATLGALIAHYEHKIFVQGIYWQINSFDQFGVTLGKYIATNLLNVSSDNDACQYDPSTKKLLSFVKNK